MFSDVVQAMLTGSTFEDKRVVQERSEGGEMAIGVVTWVVIGLVVFVILSVLAGRYGRLLAQVEILQRKLEREKATRKEVAQEVAMEAFSNWQSLVFVRDRLQSGDVRRSAIEDVLEGYRLVQTAVGLPVIEGPVVDEERVESLRQLFRLDDEE